MNSIKRHLTRILVTVFVGLFSLLASIYLVYQALLWQLNVVAFGGWSERMRLLASEIPTTIEKELDRFFYVASIFIKTSTDGTVLYGLFIVSLAFTLLLVFYVYQRFMLQEQTEHISHTNIELREAQNKWRKADLQQQNIRQQFNATHERISDCFVLLNNTGEVLYGNAKARRFFERVFEYGYDLKGGQLEMIVPGVEDTPLGKAIDIASRKATSSKIDAELRKNVWVQASVFPTTNGIYIYFTDISRSKNVKVGVSTSISLLRQILDSAPQALSITDKKWNYLAANRQWISQFKLDGNKILGRYHGQVLPDSLDNLSEIGHQVQQGDIYKTEEQVYKVSGSEEWIIWEVRPWFDDNGEHSGFIILATFTTEQRRARKKAEITREKEQQLAYHDVLTGLPNRQLFYDRLNQTLAHAYRSMNKVGLMFIDLDGFKAINDTLGHDAGDILLKEVAQRLQECVRNTDTVSRLGGDEFTIILSSIKNIEDVRSVADKISEAIAPVYDLNGKEGYVTTSIGISVYPYNGSTAVELIKAADTAMYQAKKSGKNQYCVYEREGEKIIFDKNESPVDALNAAIEYKELELHYQPQVEGLTGKVVGIEALIRWRHPKHGLLNPIDFLPIAEETGAIIAIGKWVVNEACRQNMEWRQQGLGEFPISVNISSRQFQDSSLIETIKDALDVSGLPADSLDLEITEMLLFEYAQTTLETLDNLKLLGLRLTVDDFGLNNTPLSALKNFPIDAVKIHQNFVRNLLDNEESQTVAKTIIDLANNLKIDVIGEGVETEAQAKFLIENGCKYIQGFWLGRPIKPSATADFLSTKVPKHS